MTVLKHVMVLCLFALIGISAVSAAGNGTFSIPAISGVNVGDNVTATVYLDNTWNPKAADVYLHVQYNSSLLEYTGTDFRVGHTVSATKDAGNSIFLQFGDFTNGYPNGRLPIADLKFNATGVGVSPLTVSVDHVRYYVNDTPVDIGDSAAVTPGMVAIGVATNITPTITSNVTVPITTVPTIIPNNTTLTFTPVQTTTPFNQITFAGSNDYTGVVSGQTTTTTPTTNLTTPTVTVTSTMNGTTNGTPATTMTVLPNNTSQATTPTSAITTALTSSTVRTTTTTLVPVNVTTTQLAGINFGLLSLISLGAVALLFIGRRFR